MNRIINPLLAVAIIFVVAGSAGACIYVYSGVNQGADEIRQAQLNQSISKEIKTSESVEVEAVPVVENNGTEEQAAQEQEDDDDASTVPSDWKTYTNKKYGFELEYPDGQWDIDDKNNIVYFEHIIYPELMVDMEFSIQLSELSAKKEFITYLGALGINNNNDFEQINKNYFSFEGPSPATIILNGYKGYKINDSGEGNACNKFFIDNDNLKSVVITMSFYCNDTGNSIINAKLYPDYKYLTIFNKILSTFKFIE